ncbi:hypothetical protein [Variovorax sp. LT1R16]|uniref:hypothetical protein n=1 Tax=Variovorax sp. LT1R16 TaxID=3443728 RepID=UPI003F45D2D4
MKISQLALAATFAVLAVTAVQAQPSVGRNRAEVDAEAVAAAHAPNQNVTRGSRGADPFVSSANSEAVYKQAVDTAHAPNQNVTRGSRGPDPFTSQRDPAQVYQEAMAAAAAPDQNVTSGSRVNSKVVSTMQNPVLQSAQGK